MIMTGTLEYLTLAMSLFIVSHILLPVQGVRSALVRVLGEKVYLVIYSGLSIGLLAWIVEAYNSAPVVEFFEPSTAMRHGSLTLMLISVYLLVGGVLTRNPSLVPAESLGWRPEARGVFKITRHPVMWGIALWGGSHFLANGHFAAIILFGGMTVLALAGAVHIDHRKRQTVGEDWLHFEAETSFVPLVAIAMGKVRIDRREIPWWHTLACILIYIGLLAGHATLGKDVFPMGFF
jgi:uncharacterized membrane protein